MNERLQIVGGQVLLRRRPRNRVRCIAMDRYKFGTENRKPCQGGRGSAVATRHRRYAVSTLVKRFLTVPLPSIRV